VPRRHSREYGPQPDFLLLRSNRERNFVPRIARVYGITRVYGIPRVIRERRPNGVGYLKGLGSVPIAGELLQLNILRCSSRHIQTAIAVTRE
jgi:hypothetical protein